MQNEKMGDLKKYRILGKQCRQEGGQVARDHDEINFHNDFPKTEEKLHTC